MIDDLLPPSEIAQAESLRERQEPIKKYWFRNSLFITSYTDTSSLMTPRGEKFIISTVSKLASQIHDEKLRVEIANFLHEENSHGRVHEAYNRHIIAKKYSVEFLMRFNSFPFDIFEKVFSPLTCVSISMSLEYFTLFFSKYMVEHEMFKGVDERLERLWMWHCIEEMEHRGACFNLYNYLRGGYFRRAFSMIVATITFIICSTVGHMVLLHQNRGLYNPKVWLAGLSFLFGTKGIYWYIIMEWPKYFKPGFHPSHISIKEEFQKKLHHHHIEEDLLAYFTN